MRRRAQRWGSWAAPTLLEGVDGTGPVVVEQTRQRAVGEQLPTGLTARAVVGLVLGVHDPLHRRATGRTRLAIATVHRHPGPERGHTLGKVAARLRADTVDPFAKHRTRGGVEPRHLV